jgi:hypothetical protein
LRNVRLLVHDRAAKTFRLGSKPMSIKHPLRLAVAGLVAALLVACSGGGGGDARNRWDLKMGPPPDMSMGPPPYPMGPYGNKVGDTIADLMFSGYRLTVAQTDSSKLTWDNTISLSDYHANSANTCMVLSIGATWCGACQQEQPAMTGDIQSTPGLAALGILFEGPTNGTASTMQDVSNWTQQYHQDYFVVQGTEAIAQQLFQGYGSGMPPTIGLPFNLVINPKTMKVMEEIEGFDPQIASRAMADCAAN